MIKLKTKVSIYFKNRVGEVLNFLFKLLKRGAEVEVVKVNVTANF